MQRILRQHLVATLAALGVLLLLGALVSPRVWRWREARRCEAAGGRWLAEHTFCESSAACEQARGVFVSTDSGYACAKLKRGPPCQDDPDCPAGQVCMASVNFAHVETQRSCQYACHEDADCPPRMSCLWTDHGPHPLKGRPSAHACEAWLP